MKYKIYTILVFVVLFTSCEKSRNLVKNKDVKSLIMEIKSDSRDDLLYIYPKKYVYKTKSDTYEYKLSTEKWNHLEQIVNRLDLENILTSEENPQGRFIEKNISHTIDINTGTKNYKIPSYYGGVPPAYLTDLHNFLNEFLPVN